MNNLEANAENISNAIFYNLANRLLLDAEKPNSEPAREYFRSRGISEATLQRANIGYIDEWKVTEDQTPTRRIIFPRTDTAYTAFRLDLTKEDFKAINNGRQYETVGENSPYSPEGLKAWKKPVIWLTETELDVLSLYEAGAGAALAIGHAAKYGDIIETAKRHPEKVYILAFQYNEEGAIYTDAARKDLTDAEIGFISSPLNYLWLGHESANELLIKQREYLEGIINALEKDAEAAQTKTKEEQRTGVLMLEKFLESVQTRNYEPIPTGIKNIDTMLEGGLMRKTLVMLGAPPAMGKTALAQQIFESIAANGRNVLYINLEMSREQLIARSLARIAYNTDHAEGDVSPLEIMRGYKWTDRQKAAILNAADAYKQTIAPRIIYNPDPVINIEGEQYRPQNGISTILDTIKAEMQKAAEAGKEPPLICVDYLQIIDPESRDPVEGMKAAIKALKDTAIKYNTVIFCVMANNRASNAAGRAEMESGRDTSAIEYSADIMLTLNYTAIEENLKYSYMTDGKEKRKPYTVQAIRAAKAQGAALADDITLKVVKSRFSEGGRRCYFHFDGKHNVFLQMNVKYHDPMTEKKPLQLDINE